MIWCYDKRTISRNILNTFDGQTIIKFKEAFESLGVKLSSNFNIRVKYSSERKDVGTYSSVENLVISLVTSALASAIWQATGQKSGVKMPFGDKAIERYLGGDE